MHVAREQLLDGDGVGGCGQPVPGGSGSEDGPHAHREHDPDHRSDDGEQGQADQHLDEGEAPLSGTRPSPRCHDRSSFQTTWVTEIPWSVTVIVISCTP